MLEFENLLTTSDGAQICLIQVTNLYPKRHVFMTHGTFSDRRICAGLARYLAGFGFCCWILEWRGHGASGATQNPFDFETVGLEDITTALNYLIHSQGISPLDCVTHSGGGIALTMALLHDPALQQHIRSMSLMACQTSMAAPSGLARLRLRLVAGMSLMLGRTPGRALKIGPHDESHYTMRQWFNWNLQRNFVGRNGTDYLAAMNSLTMPVMALAGQGDKVIAPPSGCRHFLQAFGGHANQFKLLGPNFGHASLMSSRAARSEIWPVVLNWLTDSPGQKETLKPS